MKHDVMRGHRATMHCNGGAERKHNICKTVFILEKSAQIFTKLGISSFYQ